MIQHGQSLDSNEILEAKKVIFLKYQFKRDFQHYVN